MESYQSSFTVNGSMENFWLNLVLTKNYLEKGSSICLKNIVVKLHVINNQVCCVVILKGYK